MKAVSHKRPPFVQCHLYEVFATGNFLESREWLPLAGGGEEGDKEDQLLANRYRASFKRDKVFLN